MKTYLICTLIIWILGQAIQIKEISQKSANQKREITTSIIACIVQLGLIIWCTYLLTILL
jgi:hypothetical protein